MTASSTVDSDRAAPAPELLERWALAYLERFASSAENLRRVLLRRVARRAAPEGAAAREAARMIDALVARYREAGLLDDAVYAAGRARARLRRGQSVRRIRVGLAAKGVAPADVDAAVAALRDAKPDPDLAAACAFARRRRLGPFRVGPADRGRELAAFARAGFERRAAERVLACDDDDAIAALLGAERD